MQDEYRFTKAERKKLKYYQKGEGQWGDVIDALVLAMNTQKVFERQKWAYISDVSGFGVMEGVLTLNDHGRSVTLTTREEDPDA